MAAYYLKRAADSGNYGASQDYIKCMEMKNNKFNALPYMKLFLERWKKHKERQSLTLNIALYAYFKYQDYEETMIFLERAIDLDPKSSTLKVSIYEFQNGVSYWTDIPIFMFFVPEFYLFVYRVEESEHS